MKGQLTLVGGGQIVLSKTGRPICVRCGHFLSSDAHPDPKTGLFRTTIWCICDCYERFDQDGRPRLMDYHATLRPHQTRSDEAGVDR